MAVEGEGRGGEGRGGSGEEGREVKEGQRGEGRRGDGLDVRIVEEPTVAEAELLVRTSTTTTTFGDRSWESYTPSM